MAVINLVTPRMIINEVNKVLKERGRTLVESGYPLIWSYRGEFILSRPVINRKKTISYEIYLGSSNPYLLLEETLKIYRGYINREDFTRAQQLSLVYLLQEGYINWDQKYLYIEAVNRLNLTEDIKKKHLYNLDHPQKKINYEIVSRYRV